MPTRVTDRVFLESAQDLRILFDALPVLVSWIGADLRYRIVNRAYVEWFGENEVVGRTVTEVAGADAANVFLPYMKRALAGETVRYQAVAHYKTGTRNIDATYLPTKDSSGRTNGFIAVVSDVTSRVRAENEARESAELVESILGNVEDAITAVDDQKLYVFANEHAARLLGFRSRDELIGRNFDSVADLFDVFDESGNELPPERRPIQRAVIDGMSGEMIFGLRRKGSREIRWLRSHTAPVRAGNGRVRLVVTVLHDITEQRRRDTADRYLASATALLATSLDVDATLSKLAQLAVPSLADWAVVDLIEGSPREEPRRVAIAHVDPGKLALAREIQARFPSRWDPEAATGIEAVIRTGKPELVPDVPEESLANWSNGPEHLELLRKLAIRSFLCVPLVTHGNRTVGALTLFSGPNRRAYDEHDLAFAQEFGRRAGTAVENARLYRTVALANRQKDEFIAMLAHELRNPLAPMVNAVHLLGLPGLKPATRNRAQEVLNRQLRHLARLVDDLLDVSRITRGKVELRREHLDLCNLATEVASDQAATFEDQGIELVIDCPGEAIVFGDRTRLAQVIGNLLANALKFTPSGGKVTVRAQATDRKTAEVVVTDSGAGINPEDIGALFEPFVQGDRSLDRTRGGLGLGLAVVKGIVELHGGQVRAASPGVGLGSTFTIGLPLETRATSHATAAPKGGSIPRQMTVLVIDDNVDLAGTIADLLELAGHRVEVEHTGIHAVEAMHRVRPDVVICDIGLPQKDGYAVAEEMKRDPALASIPIIALSGYGMDADKERAARAGFASHLTKPVDPEALLALLSRL